MIQGAMSFSHPHLLEFKKYVIPIFLTLDQDQGKVRIAYTHYFFEIY